MLEIFGVYWKVYFFVFLLYYIVSHFYGKVTIIHALVIGTGASVLYQAPPITIYNVVGFFYFFIFLCVFYSIFLKRPIIRAVTIFVIL
jgi:hypothetical protein